MQVQLFFLLTATITKQIAKVKNRIASLRRKPNNQQKIMELETVLDALMRRTQQIDSVGVIGFAFPLRTLEEVNRLEDAVRNSTATREQYVRFIRTRGHFPNAVDRVLPLLFTDETISNFSYTKQNRRMNAPNRKLNSYHLFRDCLLEGWGDFGMTPTKLENALQCYIQMATYKTTNHVSEIIKK
ncbi:uncharacterized protein LOC129762525 isoform X1 [Toxorhynchites rutilus septentrionalis]|uniref:uncharacterized protein LOC129762525 isoform X1 n=1 Tax=Toxorhynchites rutilus septentrionalis TaxID=329112 RepID=UPI002479E58C|nr:uncharacterized protein LOC129762525 isoform X1 [Toxorhynchites rutilus septentrionalis]